MILLLALPVLAAAQTAQWTSPVLGYVFDQDSKSIRLLAGVPGAASADSSVALAFKLERAAISPSRLYAIAENKDAEHLYLVRLDPKAADGVILQDSPSTADLVAFSPSGNAAALLSRDLQKIQVWTGLPDQPVLARELTAPDVSALALSDDASVLAVSNDSGVSLLSSDSTRLVAPGTGYGALAFSKGTHDLAAANKSRNEVVILRTVDADTQVVAIASAQDGVADPASVAFSVDGQKLVIANSGSGNALIADLAGKNTQSIQCDCTADGLYRAQGNAVFRLTNIHDGSIALLDGDSDLPRVVLIPAGGAQ